MTTGRVESWAGQIIDIGPIYPFVGTELLLFIVGLVFWVGWHVWQLRIESKQFDEDIARIHRAGGVSKFVGQEDKG
jgi:hypothetical protein